ncbi:putative nuclease harbi1, partial [Nowakowskiella sp. JEL0078]
MLPVVVHFPDNPSSTEWEELSKLEKIVKFLNACLAVNGILIQIERPHDYEGWYFWKGYPAMNVQLVCDYIHCIQTFDVQPGSATNKLIFKYLQFGSKIHTVISKHMHILADAEYVLLRHVLAPYPVNDNMTKDKRKYNYHHSVTQISVKHIIGLLKGQFCILKLWKFY